MWVQRRIGEKAEVRGVDPGRGIVYMKIHRNESVLGELKIDGYDSMKSV